MANECPKCKTKNPDTLKFCGECGTSLKRNVALKFLPSELMQDNEAKKRFIREAQAAAALNHPNICIIHEVDEVDDQTFISMEYIEGQTLKDRIESGPLEIDEAVKIVTQVGEGLGEAHTKGIVHRDIKSARQFVPQFFPALLCLGPSFEVELEYEFFP